MAAGIVIGGQAYEVGPPELTIQVLGPQDHGLEFQPGQGHNRKRGPQDINLVAWHWTGGEGEPEQMFRTLMRRGYGVEFAVSRLGTIYQFADPLEVDTADTGGVNARSVGVEVVNYEFRNGWDPKRWVPPSKGRDRELYRMKMHGKHRTFAQFYPWQTSAACYLADALSLGLDIPRVACVADTAITKAELDSFEGHIGHFQVTTRKRDPGRLMRDLNAHFHGDGHGLV